MAFISLRQLLDHAAENGYGVPAFNVNNLEQIQAIMQAAQETDSPVILQASAGARKYAGEPYLRHMVLAAVEMHPDLPLVLHQDHGASPAMPVSSEPRQPSSPSTDTPTACAMRVTKRVLSTL